MRRVVSSLYLIIIIWVFLSWVEGVVATDYYISPNGNDSNSGLSTTAPLATFNKAWTIIAPGDRLLLMDGVYKQSIIPPFNGQPGKFITVRALNDGGAIIDGEFARIPVQLGVYGGDPNSGHYFNIEGLVAKNSSGAVFNVTSKNVSLRRNSGYNANPKSNFHVFTIASGGNATTPANVLLEDNVAAGLGRKMILVFATFNNVVLRRNFTAWQSWTGGEPIAPGQVNYCGGYWPQSDGIEVYPTAYEDQPDVPNNSIIENSINFGLTPDYAVSLSPNPGFRTGNQILGTISVGSGLRWNDLLKKFEPRRSDGSPIYDPTICRYNESVRPSVCSASKCIELTQQIAYRAGFVVNVFDSLNYIFRNNRIRDIVAIGNGSLGITAGPWGPGSVNNELSNVTFVNNGKGDPVNWAGANVDALLSEINRFDVKSNLKIGNLSGGANPAPGPGAKVKYRYLDGNLSSQSLWPWPMEDRIRREFADSNLFWADGIQGRTWPNFSVTKEVCEKMLLPNGVVDSVQDCYGGSSPIGNGDVNSDSKVDSFDLKAIVIGYLKSVTNALNQYGVDSKVNALDFVVALKRLP